MLERARTHGMDPQTLYRLLKQIAAVQFKIYISLEMANVLTSLCEREGFFV